MKFTKKITILCQITIMTVLIINNIVMIFMTMMMYVFQVGTLWQDSFTTNCSHAGHAGCSVRLATGLLLARERLR